MNWRFWFTQYLITDKIQAKKTVLHSHCLQIMPLSCVQFCFCEQNIFPSYHFSLLHIPMETVQKFLIFLHIRSSAFVFVFKLFMRNSGTKEHFVNTTNNAEKIFTKIENSVFVTMTVNINRLWIQFIIIETTLMLLFISMKRRIFFR